MLVVSPARFNAVTRGAIVLPIATGGDLARARDLAAPGGTKLERLPDAITAEVLARLATGLS